MLPMGGMPVADVFIPFIIIIAIVWWAFISMLVAGVMFLPLLSITVCITNDATKDKVLHVYKYLYVITVAVTCYFMILVITN